MERSITISLRFKGNVSFINSLRLFRELSLNVLKKEIQYISYYYLDGSRRKTKTLKYNDNCITELERDPKLLNKEKVSFDLTSYLDKNIKDYQRIDFSFVYGASNFFTINSLDIILNYSRYKEIDLINFLKHISDILSISSCQIVYGFVSCIQNNKYPAFYLVGISNDALNKDEQQKLDIWSNNFHNCDTKIWEIFWGNIISEGHIAKNPNIVKEIEKVVGSENIFELQKGIYWFNTNDDLSEFNILNPNKERQRLKNVFKKNNLIMVSYSDYLLIN